MCEGVCECEGVCGVCVRVCVGTGVLCVGVSVCQYELSTTFLMCVCTRLPLRSWVSFAS